MWHRVCTGLFLALLLTARLCGATLPADTTFEVRPTNGDNTFGGCFSATQAAASGGTGTDQTQSTSAAIALTNFTTSGAGATTLTTVTASTFTAAHQGNCVRINSGTNFTVGWYVVNSVTDDKNVVLDRTPTAGGAGSSGGGKLGGATKSMAGQTTTTLVSVILDGFKIWVKNEAWNEAFTLSGSIATGSTVEVEGYNTTRGDAPTGSSRPHLNRASGSVPVTVSGNRYRLKYLWISNSNGIGISVSGADNDFIGVRSSSNTTTGVTDTSGNSNQYVACEFDTNTTNGMTLSSSSGTRIVGSYIHGNSGAGISSGAADITLVNNLITANASHGVALTGSNPAFLVGNTIDGNTGATTDGLNLASAQKFLGTLVMNNIFSNNGRDGVRVVTSTGNNSSLWADYNDYFGNVGTARTNFPTGSHDVTTNPTFTNSAGGDFSIGTPLRNLGFPGAFPASTSTGHLDIGAVQSGAASITQGACHRTVQ